MPIPTNHIPILAMILCKNCPAHTKVLKSSPFSIIGYQTRKHNMRHSGIEKIIWFIFYRQMNNSLVGQLGFFLSHYTFSVVIKRLPGQCRECWQLFKKNGSSLQTIQLHGAKNKKWSPSLTDFEK